MVPGDVGNSLSAVGTSTTSLTISGLSANTNYDIFFAARDFNLNLAETVYKIDVMTTP